MEIVAIGFAVLIVTLLLTGVRIVPQQTASIVERLGKYNKTLNAGLHIIIPIVDKVRYRHSLKEQVLDIPEQICITSDNVQVTIDGVVFLRVINPSRASYGVSSYIQAVIQLAQTTLRSEIGKMDLDRTFEQRDAINNAVVRAVDTATDPWGVKVLRYEVKAISPPRDVVEAMEKQMRAEREKRALVLESEADRDAKINRAEGGKQEVIKNSEAIRQQQINEAEGEAAAIQAVAIATAEGIKVVSNALNSPGGADAAKLRVAEDYVKQFGYLAKLNNSIIIPANVSDMAGMIATAFSVFDGVKGKPGPRV